MQSLTLFILVTTCQANTEELMFSTIDATGAAAGPNVAMNAIDNNVDTWYQTDSLGSVVTLCYGSLHSVERIEFHPRKIGQAHANRMLNGVWKCDSTTISTVTSITHDAWHDVISSSFPFECECLSFTFASTGDFGSLAEIKSYGQAVMFFNNMDYKQGGASDCGPKFQPITDVKACAEAAGAIASKSWGSVYHRYPVNPFPNYCTTKADDVNYYINPMGVHTDPAVSVLCINSNKTCDVTDGSGVSSEYPCVCGTDTCATGEVCSESEDMCHVYMGYVETERMDKSCPTGYQTITDATACKDLADKIPGKRWGAVYDYSTVPHGCASWTSGIVNYYVNQGGSNEDSDVSMLCINSSMKCDVSDGSGVSSSYPCACGNDTCSSNEVCVESESKCELIKGIYQTERKDASCPAGYQAIDKASCYALAPMLDREWMPFMVYSGPAYGCGSWNFDTVNYFDYPGGGAPSGDPTNTESAILCMKDSSVIPIDLGKNMYHPSYNPA